MSSIAAETLVRLGYANLWELGGGFNAWQAAGYRSISSSSYHHAGVRH